MKIRNLLKFFGDLRTPSFDETEIDQWLERLDLAEHSELQA
jgi:ABC-type multidrug transport system ATPase subunit